MGLRTQKLSMLLSEQTVVPAAATDSAPLPRPMVRVFVLRRVCVCARARARESVMYECECGYIELRSFQSMEFRDVPTQKT